MISLTLVSLVFSTTALASRLQPFPRQASPIDPCTSTTTLSTITITSIAPLSTLLLPGADDPDGDYTAIYETVYDVFCPSGLEPHTYTITQPCPRNRGSSCRPSPNEIPPGFTTSISVCHTCGPVPITATLTLPHNSFTTTYDKVYPYFYPTGLGEKTYAVTQTCNKEPCLPPAHGLPPGFTTKVSTCSSCGPSPITATLTIPVYAKPFETEHIIQKPYKPNQEPGHATAPPTPACTTCKTIPTTVAHAAVATKPSSSFGTGALLLLFMLAVLSYMALQ